ncbi:TetR/AcrR family transcriptional regulator [Nocardia salmonicida]
MPRNNRPRDREEKRGEIVTAARLLFVEQGYEATSMGRLASAAGVSANTVYWYFDDKDAVLIAVLDTVVADAVADFDTAPSGLADRLLWLIDRLEQVSKLVSTVHSRILVSEEVNAWHDRFHAMGEMMLRWEVQRSGAPEAELDALVKLCVFTVEGLLTHSHDSSQRRMICSTLEKCLG